MDLRRVSREQQAAARDRIRGLITHTRIADPEAPLFGLTLHMIDDGYAILHLGLDTLIADAASRDTILRELNGLCRPDAARDLPLQYSYTQFALAQAEKIRQERLYWQQRAGQLRGWPRLPIKSVSETRPTLQQVDTALLDPGSWQRLRIKAAGRRATPTAVMLGDSQGLCADGVTRPNSRSACC
jgi:hypothetical protein